MSENGYDSEGNPLWPRWDGRERRRFPRNGKVTPLTLDQNLDRALKFATLFKFIVLPLLGGIVTVAWMNHRTLEALDTKITTTQNILLQHDKSRRDRDQVRLQIHHQADIVSGKGGCIRCKMHDRLSGGELVEAEPDISFTR